MLNNEEIEILRNKGLYPHVDLLTIDKETKRLTLDEFVRDVCGEDQVLIDSTVWISKTSKRRASFRKRVWQHFIENDLLVCPATGEKVSYCICEYVKLTGRYYYKFYSENDVEFSLDHKLPISKGGEKKNLNNLQPMTLSANRTKSDSLIYL